MTLSVRKRLTRIHVWGATISFALMVVVVPVIALNNVPKQVIDSHRLLHLFDFEEADDFNFEDLPRFWYVIGRSEQSANVNFNRQPLHQQMMARKGFPNYTTVAFNKPQIKKGQHNLHLGLNGGNAGAFLEVGALAAVPGSDYLITARVKTSDIKYARARLSAYFIDATGRRIKASTQSTILLNTKNQWQDVTLKLEGIFSNAAWIGLQTELLQPQQQSGLSGKVSSSKAGKHAVRYKQIKGDAWFDNIAVWQVPRVVVTTQSPVNLIVAPDRPSFNLQVRDLTGKRMLAVTTVYDHRHKIVSQSSRIIGQGGASQWQWEPALNRLGWYLVDLSLYESPPPKPNQLSPTALVSFQASGIDQSVHVRQSKQSTLRSFLSRQPVARTIRAFLWLPIRDHANQHEKRRFTIDAHNADAGELSLLADVLKATDLRSVIVSGWQRDTTIVNIDAQQAALDITLDPLIKINARVTMSLSPVPDEIADALDVDRHNPLWLFGRLPEHWQPLVTPMLVRQGQHVRQWQLGPPANSTTAFAEGLQKLVDTATATMVKYAPEPHIVLPWDLTHPKRDDLDDADVSYHINVPASVQIRHLGAYLKPWQAGGAPFTLHLQIPDATQMSQPNRIADLAVRMVQAWEYQPQGITIDKPWAPGTGESQYSAIHPGPLLGVFATVSDKLSGRKVIGRFNVKDGVVALICDQSQPGKNTGMLIIWNESAANDSANDLSRGAGGNSDGHTDVELFLGEKPIASDVFANRLEMKQVEDRHLIKVSRTPVFVENIDAQLALFRAGFKITPRLVEASQAGSEHTLSLHNPWNRSIQGFLTLKQPGREWRIEPRKIRFSIEPGKTKEIPIHIAAPVRALAGVKKVIAEAAFSADDQYKIELATTLRVGLPDLELDSGLTFEPNEDTGQIDAIATIFVTNTGNKPRTFYYFAIAPGHARQERIVSRLPAGQSIVRRFKFKGAGLGKAAQDFKVRVGVRDVFGPASMSQLLKP